MTLGKGTHRYEVVEGWVKFPENITVGYTHGIEVDSKGHVYVFHTGTPSVVVFDQNGNYISSWGEQFEGGAHGLYLHNNGDQEYLFLTDRKKGIVVKTTLQGEELLQLGVPDLPNIYDDERKYLPTDVAVGPNGDIYVSDGYGQSWIHQYTAGGSYINSWGGLGSEAGQLNCPHGISVDFRKSEPEIYVADRGNHRIQVFTLDGNHKRFITEEMDAPCSFYFAGEDVYIPDLHSRVTILDANDRVITHLGEDQQAYKQEGWPNLPKAYYQKEKFSSPHGVCVDFNNSVYVAEWISDGRVTKLELKN